MQLNLNCGIYIIISPTNKRYIGSSKSLKKRFNRYKNYSCSRQSAILASLKKYGFDNHKVRVLFYCEESELLFWERVFGDIYRSLATFENGLNITLPGYGDVPQVRTKEFRDRVSETQKNRFKDNLERENISIKTKAALNSPDINKRIRDAQKRRYDNVDERIRRSETRKKYYENNPDAKEAARQKTILAYQNNPNLREIAKNTFKKYYQENPDKRKLKEKKVVNINTGEVFAGISCILGKVGVTRKVMQNRLRGYSKNPTPYRYYNE